MIAASKKRFSGFDRLNLCCFIEYGCAWWVCPYGVFTVVLIMAWLIVLIKGKQKQLKSLNKKELVFITLSGLATGGSWLCYYYAIQNGVVSVVVPIDKMSIVIAVLFSYIVFKEKLGTKALIGLILMVLGTLALAVWA